MDEFVLMRFSSTPHGLEIYAWPVAVDKSNPSNRQLFFQISNQPVPMCSQEKISSTAGKEEKCDDVSSSDETVYISSDSEISENTEEPVKNEKKRRMPPRRCKKNARKKYCVDKSGEIDKIISQNARIAVPSIRARIPYHKRYCAF
jgi:hypothetical protein